jgi:hypothetical protein
MAVAETESFLDVGLDLLGTVDERPQFAHWRLRSTEKHAEWRLFIDLGRFSRACGAVFMLCNMRRPVAAQSAGQFDRQ